MEVYLWIQAWFKMYRVGMHVQVSVIFRVFLDWLDIIEGFLKVSKPMTELLEKDKKFEWKPHCEACFQQLKR
jgi:hypothetical protein